MLLPLQLHWRGLTFEGLLQLHIRCRVVLWVLLLLLLQHWLGLIFEGLLRLHIRCRVVLWVLLLLQLHWRGLTIEGLLQLHIRCRVVLWVLLQLQMRRRVTVVLRQTRLGCLPVQGRLTRMLLLGDRPSCRAVL